MHIGFAMMHGIQASKILHMPFWRSPKATMFENYQTQSQTQRRGGMCAFRGNARRAFFKLAVVSIFVIVHTVWSNKTALGTLDEFRLGAWEVFFMHFSRVVNRH